MLDVIFCPHSVNLQERESFHLQREKIERERVVAVVVVAPPVKWRTSSCTRW